MRSVKSWVAVSGEWARERRVCAMWGLGVVIFMAIPGCMIGGWVCWGLELGRYGVVVVVVTE